MQKRYKECNPTYKILEATKLAFSFEPSPFFPHIPAPRGASLFPLPFLGHVQRTDQVKHSPIIQRPMGQRECIS